MITVKLNHENDLLEVELPDGDRVVLQYSVEGTGSVDIYLQNPQQVIAWKDGEVESDTMSSHVSVMLIH